jgi:aspartate-semialdehyde dehydrogenase
MTWHRIGRSGYDVAVVGATGAVGEILLELLEKRRFPLRNLRLLASERSVGEQVMFARRSLGVDVATPEAFDGADLVFFAATGELSRTLAPEAVERGALVIDKSSTWRLAPHVPLVVPEVNPAALDEHQGIIACPNCTTIGLVMALEPLRRRMGLRSVVATTFQAVSGAGRDGVLELEAHERARAKGETIEPRLFARSVARNVVPLCDRLAEDGHTLEEHKLRAETRKILGLPSLAVSVTAVRVPVAVGHSVAALVEGERSLDVDQAGRALAEFEGVRFHGGDAAPTPHDVEHSDDVLVGRLRRDPDTGRLWLWSVSNNLRKGAATNAIQIAETMQRRGLLDQRARRTG